MKRYLLLLGLCLAPSLAQAQSPACVGVGGVNTVPVVGVSCPQEPIVASFAATAVGLVAASAPTDIACITGSATRVVRVQQIRVSGTITTQLVVPAFITKHAAANTGGTPATGTALPVPYSLDTTVAAATTGATATTVSWTANPTIADAAPGIIDSANLVLSKADSTNGSGNTGILFDYANRSFMSAPVLRGVAQQLCVNLNANAGTMTGNAISVTFKWTELLQ